MLSIFASILILGFSSNVYADSLSTVIPVGGDPHGLAVNSITNITYVTNLSSDTISVIDENNTVIATIPVGDSPSGVSVNTLTNMIYVANQNSNSVTVIDGNTNSVITTIFGVSSPDDVAINENTNTIYAPQIFSGSVAVIDGNTNTVIATIPVGTTPVGIAINPTTNTVYVTNQSDDSISVIDGNTNSVITTIPVGGGPAEIDVNISENKVYVANQDTDNLSVIDGNTNSVITTILVNDLPLGVAYHDVLDRVYVVNFLSDNISIIDDDTNTVIETLSVPNPREISINSDTNLIYVSNSLDDTVSLIRPLPEGTAITPHNAVVPTDEYTFRVFSDPGPQTLDFSPPQNIVKQLWVSEAPQLQNPVLSFDVNGVTYSIDVHPRMLIDLEPNVNVSDLKVTVSDRTSPTDGVGVGFEYQDTDLPNPPLMVDDCLAAPNTIPDNSNLGVGSHSGHLHHWVYNTSEPQTRSYPNPEGPIDALFTTVTTGVSGAYLCFDVNTVTYTISIGPNSNQVITFDDPVVVSNVRISIDSRGNSDDAGMVSYFVSPNTAPVATNDDYSVDEDNSLNVAAPGILSNDNDAEGDILTTTVTSNVSDGIIIVNSDGSFDYTPNVNFFGTDSFTYILNDGTLDSNIATVTIDVIPVNDAPVANNDSISTDEDTSINGLVTASDVEGDTLTFMLVTNSANGNTILNTDGTFTFTPNADYNGSDSFTFKANDGTLDSNIATVTIDVIPVNDAPVCNVPTVDKDSLWPPNHKMKSVTASMTASDIDGDNVMISIINVFQDEPVNGSGDGNTSPDAEITGIDTVDVRAERSGNENGRVYTITILADDGNGGICTGEVSVGVPHDKKDIAVNNGAIYDSTVE